MIAIHPKYQAYSPYIARIPEIFDTEGFPIHLGRNTVKRFPMPGGDWVVKRYKRPNIVQRIAHTFFKKGKAERAYLYARRLLEKGIDTPEGIACIVLKRHGLLCDSYFISTACDAPAVYPDLVRTEQYDRRLADSLAAFFVQLHTRGVLHGDPNLNNILYRRGADGSLHFSVIDTNRSRFRRHPSRRQCLENLKRVTHRRDLLQYIVEKYATLRQWDAEASVRVVMKALDRFERRKKARRMIRRK